MAPQTETRQQIRDRYEESDDAPTECWDNYGDAIPAPHGGNWVHYDGRWDFRGTFMAEDIGYDMEEFDVDDPLKAQYVYSSLVHWQDIITEDGEWTDAMQSTVDSLHRGPETPLAAVVNDRLTWLVAAYADEVRRAYNRQKPVLTGDYDDILRSVGVEPCDHE